MKEIPPEVIKWLKENAYAVKASDYWLFPDFPPDSVPDKLEIPTSKKLWQALKKGEATNGMG